MVVQPRSSRYRAPSRFALAAAAVLTAGGLTAFAAPATADPQAPAAGTDTYFVLMDEPPATAYQGGEPGLPATRPKAGDKLDTGSAGVRRYVGHLRERHDSVLAAAPRKAAPAPKKLYDYDYTVNGFAARLTAGQAAALAHTRGVTSVSPAQTATALTDRSPAFLGLDGRDGLWNRLGGSRDAGRGIVVADLDSGIVPENPSFAPLRGVPARPRGWHGTCQTGQGWTADDCNSKIVGARWYVAGWGEKIVLPADFLSPRDGTGHGSHTASTAAGDHGVTATIQGADFGQISGVAPAARLAVYKVCWLRTDGSCGVNAADVVAAVEDAVRDGADVINYSIATHDPTLTIASDPVEMAFRRAADAGVFVAAAGGNTGAGPAGTVVNHPQPWVTTVAAGTEDRTFNATVTLGDGRTLTGASMSPAVVGPAPLVRSSAVAAAGASPNLAAQCWANQLDPAKVAGTIVECDRGGNDRVAKSATVKAAGGVGMILVNLTPNTTNAEIHSVPTVHFDGSDGLAVRTYAGQPGATATIGRFTRQVGGEAPTVAPFSLHGPSPALGGTLLKPDVMAPGQDILAALAPTEGGQNWGVMSGTSMSSPEVAGLAALLRQAHPRWSPMMIKSAVMTTATTLDNKGNPIPGNPFFYGAGEIVPTKAVDPGLVFDSRLPDWVRLQCATGDLKATDPDCVRYGTADPLDFNVASLAVPALAGVAVAHRTLTNVGLLPARYTAQASGLPGFTVSVSPRTLFLLPGQSAKVAVTLTRTTAAFGQYASGAVTWSEQGGVPWDRHAVTIPVVARPVPSAEPATVAGTGATGSVGIPARSGYAGTWATSVSGLVPATVTTTSLPSVQGTAAFDPSQPAPGQHTAKYPVTVPAGTTLARFATSTADYPAGTFVDVYVYRAGTSSLLASARTIAGAADAHVDLTGFSGDVDVYLDVSATPVDSLDVKGYTWLLGGPTGNLTASPASAAVTAGQQLTVTAAWSDLEPGRRWLGLLNFSDGANPVGSTLLSVTS
ncbi:MAG: S8 family serine peptidase [Mycobacteriales bacterium]